MRTTKEQVLKFIRSYVEKHKYAPSYREIAHGVDLTAVSTIAFYVKQLISEGELETDHPGSPRALRLTEGGRICDTVNLQ